MTHGEFHDIDRFIQKDGSVKAFGDIHDQLNHSTRRLTVDITGKTEKCLECCNCEDDEYEEDLKKITINESYIITKIQC